MAKVIISQGFCEAICKHICIINVFDNKFIINYIFTNMIMLKFNIFSLWLVFCIFHKNDVSLFLYKVQAIIWSAIIYLTRKCLILYFFKQYNLV